MRVAIVGLGGMGNVHFHVYKGSEKAEIVAVCDIRVEMAREKMGDCTAKLYADFDEMLKNEKIDLIDICTPSHLHAEHVLKALDYGANVICEKPMAMNSEEAKKILEKVEETGKFFMVAHVIRFMKGYTYLKQIVDSKKYGGLVRLDMKRLSKIPLWSYENWMMDEKRSGLSPLDLMIHDVDFMQYTFGMPKDIVGARYKMNECNDYSAVTYIYDGFTISTEGAWFNTYLPFMSEYLAIFEDGYIKFRDGKLIECGEEIDLEKPELIENSDINVSESDGYKCEIEYFIDCINSGKKPQIVTPESSAASIELMELTEKKLNRV